MDAGIFLPLVVVLGCCVLATVTDIRQYKIYNALTLPVLLGGIVYHLVGGGLASSLLGALVGFFILFIPYLIGAMGGGDVKLMAAIGSWVGVETTLLVIGIGCAAAAICSLALLARQGRLRESWIGLQIAFLKLQALSGPLGCEDDREHFRESVQQARGLRRRVVPFSIMLTVGVIVALGIRVWSQSTIQ
ncbi:A24 family peptidase [Roseiconus nitratireducens]|nr:A24 family peptidase [Roseiconus nitratireducens]